MFYQISHTFAIILNTLTLTSFVSFGAHSFLDKSTTLKTSITFIYTNHEWIIANRI